MNEHKPIENDPFDKMKQLKLRNPRQITIGHLNINSIRNKFHIKVENNKGR